MPASIQTKRPAPGVSAFFIEGECLLFSVPTQQAFILNTAAGVIWCWLEDGLSRDEMIDGLSGEFALSRADGETFVDQAFSSWQSLGLLEGYLPQCEDQKLPPAPRALTPVFAPWSVRTYRLLERIIQVRLSSPEPDAIISSILGHLVTEASDTPDITLDVLSEVGSIRIALNGVLCAECATMSELAPLIKGLVWAEAVNSSDFLFGFHAGVVADSAGALMLPGRSGSGKSTLTAMLVASGLTYLSDEMALLAKGTFDVRSLPLAFCIKDTGIAALSSVFPELGRLPIHNRGDGKRVLYMVPKPHWLLPAGGTRPVEAIVFPTYNADTDLKLEPLTPGETVRRLLADCLVVGKTLELADIEDLISWVKGVPCWSLTFASSSQAVAALKPMLEFRGAPE